MASCSSGSCAKSIASGISGSAYVYQWNGSSYDETKLTASDAATGDSFGYSVAVSEEGQTVAVGSIGDDDGGISSGTAYVFTVDNPPVIALNGDSELTLEAGVDTYTELGATATDDVDETIDVVVGGDVVDSSMVGTYVVLYDATDSAGNAAIQVTRTVNVVDTTAPETAIDSATDGGGMLIAAASSTLSEAMSFVLRSSEAGSTFECSLDGAGFEACTSPEQLVDLAEGSHTLQVRATDAAGNTDPTPAAFQWTVLSAAGAIEQLAQAVIDLGLTDTNGGQGVENGMLKILSGAVSTLEDSNPDNDVAAIGKLNEFIDQVEYQRGVRLNDAQADDLVGKANKIIDEIAQDIALATLDVDPLDLLLV